MEGIIYFCEMRRLLLLLLILGFYSNIFAQSYPVDYFNQPLDGVLQVSGTFAELRGNHFHSGLDLRTNSKEGLPVMASADGYVVRIKISPFGFGKAIYINHPNGYTTVYAHMQGFNDAINDWVRAQQYKLEAFDVDLFPPKDILRVTKGEIIGNSGNSGSSEGPHLHFEIRETNSEMPVDPELFGLPVKDFIRPTMHGLRIYPEGKGSTVNGKPDASTLALAGWGPVYRLKITDTIQVNGKFSLGISASDLLNETSNRNGINGYAVFIDSVKMFDWKAVTFNFNESRYVNSFIDYPYYYATNQRFMRTHTDPGNKLSMYVYNPSKGIFSAKPGSVHYVKVVVNDSKNNESILRFIVKADNPVEADATAALAANNKKDKSGPSNSAGESSFTTSKFKTEDVDNISETPESKNGLLFTIDKVNNFATPDMRISLPGKCLYDSIRFTYATQPGQLNMYSKVIKLHYPSVPLQDYFDLSIKLEKNPFDVSKLVVVRINSMNKPSSVGGKYENGFMKVKLRDFGRYAVMVDTTAPAIKAVNIKEGMQLKEIEEIKVIISDNLSGISTYRGTLNGAWILMDYDAKNRLLTYKRDALLLPGNNVLSVTIVDGTGNQSTKQWNLIN